jgi:hypothetical protein
VFLEIRNEEEGRRKKEEGRRKKEEGRRKKEEGRKFLFFLVGWASLPLPREMLEKL